MAFLHKYNVKLHKVTPQAINLNVLLLFFVSLEPFLFNELNANFSVQYVSMIYALDLGGLFAVEAFLSNCVLTEINRPNELYCDFRHSRNMQTVAALFFFVSVIPFFWTLQVPLSAAAGVPVRFIMWFIPLLLHPIEHYF